MDDEDMDDEDMDDEDMDDEMSMMDDEDINDDSEMPKRKLKKKFAHDNLLDAIKNYKYNN